MSLGRAFGPDLLSPDRSPFALCLVIVILIFAPMSAANHNPACRTGSFSISTSGSYDCGGESVGGPGAIITLNPGISVTFQNVNSFQAASFTGNGLSSGTGCSAHGQSAAKVTIKANTVSIGSVSLNGGNGGDALSGSSCAGGNGGDAGSFVVSSSGAVTINSVSVIPGNGGRGKMDSGFSYVYCGSASSAGHAGAKGNVIISGSRIGGDMTVSGNGGQGGSSGGTCSGVYSSSYSSPGQGSDGSNVEIYSHGSVALGSVHLRAGDDGNSGAWNYDVYGRKGGRLVVGNSTHKALSVQVGYVDIRAGNYGGPAAGGGELSIASSGPVNIGTIDAYAFTSSGGTITSGGIGGSLSIESGSTVTVGGISAYGGNGMGASTGTGGYSRPGGMGGSVTVIAINASLPSVNLNGGSGLGYSSSSGGDGGSLTVKGVGLVAGTVAARGGDSGSVGARGGTVDLSGVGDARVSTIDVSGGNSGAYYAYLMGSPGSVSVKSNLCVGASCGGSVRGGTVYTSYNPSTSIAFAPPSVCVVGVPA